MKSFIELEEFDIQYKLQTAMKGQAIVDFMAEFTSPSQIGEEINEEGSAKNLPAHQLSWKLFVDGSSNKGVRTRICLDLGGADQSSYKV